MRYGWVGCGWRALRDCLSVVVLWLGEWKAVGGAHNNIARVRDNIAKALDGISGVHDNVKGVRDSIIGGFRMSWHY